MSKANTLNKRYYKPTSSEIDEIIRSTIPENTRRATSKWVKILENWCRDVGYDYGIETITDKNQLEREMTEFILGIRQINTNKEYAPSSLINCIKLLSVYILKHPRGNKIFNLSNRKEFSHLWEALNAKM